MYIYSYLQQCTFPWKISTAAEGAIYVTLGLKYEHTSDINGAICPQPPLAARYILRPWHHWILWLWQLLSIKVYPDSTPNCTVRESWASILLMVYNTKKFSWESLWRTSQWSWDALTSNANRMWYLLHNLLHNNLQRRWLLHVVM